jgi:hypothetical protein
MKMNKSGKKAMEKPQLRRTYVIDQKRGKRIKAKGQRVLALDPRKVARDIALRKAALSRPGKKV